MKMNKKNKNGFTLVELVVVVCIFGIILSAILNFIKPANEIHNDVQATRDANVISSGIIEYLDDELRYATNILVLKDYRGVPEVSETGYVGTYGVPFTSCIVIDNAHFRGFGTSGYSNSEDDTAAKRMGATGQVLKVNKIDTEGFNLNNSQVVKGEAFYDNFKFLIEVGANDSDIYYDKTLQSLQVSVQTSFPVYENGEYVFHRKFDRGTDQNNDGEKTKDRGAVLSLTNINMNDGDPMNLEMVRMNKGLNAAQSEGHQESLGYPIAAAPAGATESQSAFYNLNNEARYTYIFYKKSGAKAEDDGSCIVKFTTDTPVKNTTVGSTVTANKGDVFKDFPSAPDNPGYSTHYWLAPDGSEVKLDVGYVLKGNTTFKLVYVPNPEPSPYTVTWIEADGSSYPTPGPVPVGKPATNTSPTKFDSSKKAVNEATGGWVEQGTGKPYFEVPIDQNRTFVADLVDKYPVHFKFSDSDIKDGEPVVSGKYAVNPAEVPVAPEGKIFDKWVVSGATSKDIATTPITAETTFVPTFKDKPSDINGWTMSYTANNMGATEWDIWADGGVNYGKCAQYSINVMFHNDTAGASFTKYKVKITLDKACKLINVWNVDITGNGTKNITVSPSLWNPITNGQSHDLNNSRFLFTDPTVKILKVELVSLS